MFLRILWYLIVKWSVGFLKLLNLENDILFIRLRRKFRYKSKIGNKNYHTYISTKLKKCMECICINLYHFTTVIKFRPKKFMNVESQKINEL